MTQEILALFPFLAISIVALNIERFKTFKIGQVQADLQETLNEAVATKKELEVVRKDLEKLVISLEESFKEAAELLERS